jgi:hydrogenase-4 component E
MSFDVYEILALAAAVFAILMLGTTNLRLNLWFYGVHTLVIALETWWVGHFTIHNDELFWPGLLAPMNISIQQHTMQAIVFGIFKGIGAPLFLNFLIKKLKLSSDPGTFLPAPLAMHLNIILFGLSYLLAVQLPGLSTEADSRIGAMAAMSLLFTGVLLMLTRKLAISQIIGFLVMENGIFFFALTQTDGMPMIIEMVVLLDVLVGVMISGLMLFSINKSFEHIDVTRVLNLRD